MLCIEIIGSLGHDAGARNINGRDYVAFDVACTVGERPIYFERFGDVHRLEHKCRVDCCKRTLKDRKAAEFIKARASRELDELNTIAVLEGVKRRGPRGGRYKTARP